jgi:hypothetical protein
MSTLRTRCRLPGLEMIVTDHFVYIHVSRSAGTFLNKLILKHVPGARMLQYHGQLRDLPAEYAGLPVIGFVRNPWDWYVSMYCDYRRKQQYVFQILSDRGALGFQPTVTRFLQLGDDNDQSKRLRDLLARAAPRSINARNPTRRQLPGLRSAQFASYPPDTGYYSWLFQLMFESGNDHLLHIGRFENLREETLRLFEETGTPISDEIAGYLKEAKPLNSSSRPKSFVGGYPPKLDKLVADRDRQVVDRFDYSLSEAGKYPEADPR